jgi:hypothetical protein
LCIYQQTPFTTAFKKIPYSKAVKILAVSYEDSGGGEPNSEILIDVDSATLLATELAYKRQISEWRKKHGLHIKKGLLDNSNLIDIKQLDQAQINKLTHLIYNTDYKKKGINSSLEYSCFEPRNAFVFFDASGKVFDYIEICFHCRGYDSPNKKIDIGKLCSQKYEILSDFFINIGITYGTNVWKNPAHQDNSSEDINDQETEETDE